MLDGRPPERTDEAPKVGGTGRRAALTLPRGVEEAVMFAAATESDVERREGKRIGEVGEVG